VAEAVVIARAIAVLTQSMTIVIMMTAATSESATVAMEEGMEEAITTVATIREEAVAAGTRAAARASTGVFTLGRKRRAWPPTPPPMLGLQVWLAGLKLTRRRLGMQTRWRRAASATGPHCICCGI